MIQKHCGLNSAEKIKGYEIAPHINDQKHCGLIFKSNAQSKGQYRKTTIATMSGMTKVHTQSAKWWMLETSGNFYDLTRIHLFNRNTLLKPIN